MWNKTVSSTGVEVPTMNNKTPEGSKPCCKYHKREKELKHRYLYNSPPPVPFPHNRAKNRQEPPSFSSL